MRLASFVVASLLLALPTALFAGGEASVALWMGDGAVAPADASAEVPCFFCVPVSLQKSVAFDRASVVAARFTKWGGEASRVPGIGFETGWANGDAREAKVNFLYLAVMPMLRLPLLVTPSTPDGRLNLYAGLGLAVSGGGSATLEDMSLPHSVSGNPRGTGTTTAIGLRWRHGRFIASIERRSLDLGLTFSDFGGGHASLDYDATIYAIGLGRVF